MRVHSKIKIGKIKELRKGGHSINEIVVALGVPKTTVWHHIRMVKVRKRFLPLLESKRGGSRKRKLKAVEESIIQARNILADKKFHATILSMLYWAEGNKESCVFTNTDPVMIKIFINTMEECFDVRKERYSVTVRYFTGMNRNACLVYWSRQLGIGKKYISMYYNDGYAKGRSPYGICRLTVRKGSYILKVLKAIASLIATEINKV